MINEFEVKRLFTPNYTLSEVFIEGIFRKIIPNKLWDRHQMHVDLHQLSICYPVVIIINYDAKFNIERHPVDLHITISNSKVSIFIDAMGMEITIL